MMTYKILIKRQLANTLAGKYFGTNQAERERAKYASVFPCPGAGASSLDQTFLGETFRRFLKWFRGFISHQMTQYSG